MLAAQHQASGIGTGATRGGQKRRVFVYRFLATGTIEEKVLA